ncbi:MAG: metallophosphoesterase [Bacteroidetes bacterium]|nr:metallophosphoesterase [Bacteroidota bacterium]
MRIQFCSDLHLELDKNRSYLAVNPLKVCGDVLILAGDITPLHDEYLNNPFIRFISKNYKRVFWVPGNHEYYYKNISAYSTSYSIRISSNVFIINNSVNEFEGVRFVFSTLWSKISREKEKTIEQCVADFECIQNNNRKFKSSDYNKLHDESLSFIRHALARKTNRTVVVTHHLPSWRCNSPTHNASPINEAFCTDLTSFIEETHPNFWIYGHSHFNQKSLIIGETLVVTNQLGYVHLNEHADFRQNAFFSV